MKDWLKTYGPFIAIALIMVGWVTFFYFVSPNAIVERIGIRNSYLVAFVLAVICGFSSITATTFYVAVAALSNGGANPWLLGLSGGLGLCVSDFAFYFVASKGSEVIGTRWSGVTKFIQKWAKLLPDAVVFGIVFLYSAFSPLPNDILLVALALAGYSFKKIAPFLFIGDIVSVIVLAFISH